MAITTAADIAKLQSFNKAYDAFYDRTFANAADPTQYGKVCLPYPVNVKTMSHDWMTGVPTFQRWVGAKKLRNRQVGHNLVVTTHPYEATFGVGKYDMMADHLNLLRPNIQMLAEEGVRWPGRLFTECLMANAASSDVYPLTVDGVAFFSTAHTYLHEGGTTWSNLGTDAFSPKALTAARAKMVNLKDGDGRPLGVRPDTLMIPTILEEAAFAASQSVLKPSSSLNDTNFIRTLGLDVIVNPLLPGDTIATAPWFLFDTSQPIKPFIQQSLQMPKLVYVEDPTNPAVFFLGQYLYGGEAHLDFAPAFPQLGYANDPGSLLASAGAVVDPDAS